MFYLLLFAAGWGIIINLVSTFIGVAITLIKLINLNYTKYIFISLFYSIIFSGIFCAIAFQFEADIILSFAGRSVFTLGIITVNILQFYNSVLNGDYNSD